MQSSSPPSQGPRRGKSSRSPVPRHLSGSLPLAPDARPPHAAWVQCVPLSCALYPNCASDTTSERYKTRQRRPKTTGQAACTSTSSSSNNKSQESGRLGIPRIRNQRTGSAVEAADRNPTKKNAPAVWLKPVRIELTSWSAVICMKHGALSHP